MKRTAKCVVSLLLSIGVMIGGCMNSVLVVAAEENAEEPNLDALYEETEMQDEAVQYEDLDLSEITTIDELCDLIDQDTEESVDGLTEEYETVNSTLSDFDAYQANPTLTETFYNTIVEDIKVLSIRLREYALKGAEIIVESDTDFDDKYDELKFIYDDIYDDAADYIYDEIYDDLLDDMYDDIYNGIVDDAYDTVAYDIWDDARSAEYDLWDNARSEIYTIYDNLRSDIYTFYDSIRSHTYKENIEKINKDIARLQKKTDKLKGKNVEPAITIDLDTLDLTAITTIDDMDAIVEADVEALVSSLYTELETIETELDSYEKYAEDSSRTEDFYDHVVEEVEAICNRLKGYALRYAEIIINSDMDFGDQYDELTSINDSIYTYAGPTLNQGIYNGVLKDALKYFYKDILKSGFDIAPYSDVSSFRSDEYSNVSDARSDVYSEISDMRSDIYSFTSDLRSAVYGKDIDKANKKMEKFKKDID